MLLLLFEIDAIGINSILIQLMLLVMLFCYNLLIIIIIMHYTAILLLLNYYSHMRSCYFAINAIVLLL